MSQEDIAKSQLSALETLKAAVDGSKAMTVVMGTKTQGITDAIDSAKAYGQTLNDELDKVFSPENVADYGSSLTAAIKSGFDEDLNKAFTQSTGRMVGELLAGFENAPTLMKQKLEEENVFKDMNFNEAIGELMGQIGAGINGLTENMAQGIIDTIATSLGLSDAQKTVLENEFKTVETTMDSFMTVMNNVATFLVGLGVDSLDDWIAGSPGTNPGTAPPADDFIWRPGEPVQHFNEDDLLIGGTDLMGEQQNRGYTDPNMEGLSNLSNTLTSFVSNILGQNETESINVDYNQMIGRVLDIAQQKLETPVIPETTNSFEKISEIGKMVETAMTNNTNNGVNGDLNLNVGGKIDLSVDGRNLPQNISSEQLANEIVNNPGFTSKLMAIFTDKNNTYSV
jgi:hypothetical protein